MHSVVAIEHGSRRLLWEQPIDGDRISAADLLRFRASATGHSTLVVVSDAERGALLERLCA